MFPVANDFEAFFQRDQLFDLHEPEELYRAPHVNIQKFTDFLHSSIITYDGTMLHKADCERLGIDERN